MGLVYSVTRNLTPTAGQDILTFTGGATRSFRILGYRISGLGTASAANDFAFFRQTTVGITGGGAIVPAPVNPASPAFSGTVNTTWATQPAVAAVALERIGPNANGGIISKTFTDAEKIDVQGGGAAALNSNVSLRAVSAAAAPIDVTVMIEEF